MGEIICMVYVLLTNLSFGGLSVKKRKKKRRLSGATNNLAFSTAQMTILSQPKKNMSRSRKGAEHMKLPLGYCKLIKTSRRICLK